MSIKPNNKMHVLEDLINILPNAYGLQPKAYKI